MTGLRRQRGATLVIALIMLILLTLFAVSALNTSTTNLKVVGNMQAQTEAFNAAQAAIESVISTPLFTTSPANAVTAVCAGGGFSANQMCTDYAGNWTTNYNAAAYIVRLTPQPACVTVRAIKLTELIFAFGSPDNECALGQAQQFGVVGAVTGDSLCANSVWEITAETVAAVSGAKAAAVQGIGIRISTDAMATSCI